MTRLLLRLLPLLPPAILSVAEFQPASAQEEVVARIQGEVRVGEERLTEGTVVLHLVSAETSGEIDSVRVAVDGTFTLTLPHVPDHAARPEIFFASIQYAGLHYFGPAITDAAQLDTLYLIQAYDTVSVPSGGARLPLVARNLYLELSEDGWLATDVFLIMNEGEKTLYSVEEGAVWSYPLPPSATDFQQGQGEMAPDLVQYADGRMALFSPIPPGERNLVVQYRIPRRDFLLPMPGRTDRMEVLIREPAPDADFTPLTPMAPMELEPGALFRRYAADNLIDLEIEGVVASDPWTMPGELLGLLVAALLGGAGVFGYRKRARVQEPARREGGGSRREKLLLDIALLDERFRSEPAPSPQIRHEYENERRRLLSQVKKLS